MKVFFIAICGVGVGNLALLLHKQGHNIRGSELSPKTFYPPVADLLKANEIPVTFGFDPEEITSDLDLVIMGGAALIHDPENPQVRRAKELGLKLISYAEGIGEFISKIENIEVVGNHGKTTTTSLIAHILKEMQIDPSYFIGGAAVGFEETIHSGESEWSVCEGDEHPSLGQQPGGKFMYHKPKHLVLTSADHDHKNIYPTEAEYLNTYTDLFKILPEDGKITACFDASNVLKILRNSKNRINLYSILNFKNESNRTAFTLQQLSSHVIDELDALRYELTELFERIEKFYFVSDVDYNWKPNLSKFKVYYWEKSTQEIQELGVFETPLIGQIGVENSLASISTLYSLGFEKDLIKKSLVSFKGVKRKLETIHENQYRIINDHAHSPIKIQSSILAVRSRFPQNNLFVIFHINQSGLKEERTFRSLKNVFNNADYVLIPRVMPDPQSSDPIYGKDYKELIQSGAEEASQRLKPGNVFYTPVITQLRSILENNLKQNDIILIMSTGDATEFIAASKNIIIS